MVGIITRNSLLVDKDVAVNSEQMLDRQMLLSIACSKVQAHLEILAGSGGRMLTARYWSATPAPSNRVAPQEGGPAKAGCR